jgi:hypothetical protein
MLNDEDFCEDLNVNVHIFAYSFEYFYTCEEFW